MSATIFALSTVPGVSAIAIVRLSGPHSFKAASILCGVEQPVISEMRRTHLRKIYSNEGMLLDEAIVVFFEANKSFTGERMVEFHLHGSPSVIRTVLGTLSKLKYLRAAEAGEFTKQALENNRLNIFEAEGLSDLLLAETEAQQKQALNVYSGLISDRISKWKSLVVKMLSLVESSIDFSDEVEIDNISNLLRIDLQKLENFLVGERDGFKAAEAIRDGFEVAFVGSTNVGKSTLLNSLARRNVAITSGVSGTTRDIIELKFNLNGLPVTFLDTAGLRFTKDIVEKIGVANSIDRANNSDIRIFLVDDIGEIKSFGVIHKHSDIILRPKGDLPGREPSISGKTGKGLDLLLKALSETLENKASEASSITMLRHLEKVKSSLASIEKLKNQIDSDYPEIEIIAEELRNILRSFDGLLGLVDTEEVLGEIFANFCIGK
tara:strand:- start:3220 stop:4527 length:1308 start_codon:yes stop_codon:yes gene_type:complete